MQFKTQKQILEYLGKNPNDRSLIQRMRLRWEVYKEDWMYHLITNKQSLIEENRELKMRLKEIEESEQLNSLNFQQTADILKLQWELSEAKIQWEYFERLYDDAIQDMDKRIFKAFQWIKQRVKWADWDEFHDWIMSDEEE